MATNAAYQDTYFPSLAKTVDGCLEDFQADLEKLYTFYRTEHPANTADLKTIATAYTAIGKERNKLRRKHGLNPLKGAPSWVIDLQSKRKP